MTTEHIEGLDGIEELIGKIGSNVPKRRTQLRKERDGRRRHEANVALGAAAALQRSRDRRAILDEEEEQLDNIERMAGALLDAAEADVLEPEETPLPEAAEDVVDVDALYTREDLEDMTDDQLLELALIYGLDVVDRDELIDAIIDAQHIWCIENGSDDPNQEEYDDGEVDETTTTVVRRSIVNVIDVRGWTGMQWVFALIGTILAIILWSFWPEWPGRNIDTDWVQNLVNFAWFIAHLGVGFFGGAIIGAKLEDR